LPELTKEQKEISDDFMRYWHERLGSTWSFQAIESFNHGYPIRTAPKTFVRTLEIGAGLGEHVRHEKLTAEQRQNYFALELRENMVAEMRRRVPDIQALCGDCQGRLDFPDDFFDRIVAIHVLEHLPNLPEAAKELHRVCNKQRGVFSVVIPCEGGLLYSFARLVSSRRMFELRYKQSYNWFIEREHLSIPAEIVSALAPYFEAAGSEYFPFKIPTNAINLCIGLKLKPKNLP